ncbi:hypothetical protein C8R41DRAFT_894690 [Lentinula lateritia]|uniref:Exocyst subunit Exo70 family protein n=1 Tax=Lentinula lateritia TaxID=40482 RepID=A0ABQ8VLN3_9AGAR|nr:hypothetical protein C8R41DRAFT_894690 [Lentinula lateritia]
MDNAANNDTTTTGLERLIPTFAGMLWRIRCILHILNLIAKVCIIIIIIIAYSSAILAHFTKQMKRKKSNNSTSTTATPEEEILNDDLAEAPAMQENEELDDIAIADEDEASAVLDAAQVVHDNGVIKTGVFIASNEQKRAEGIIPKVSGLARRVNDSSSVLKPEFERLVASTPELRTDKTALSRRVPTRWNSEYSCLCDHILLRKPVEQLTGQSQLKLSAYRLNALQWPLAKELRNLLKIFLDATNAFSRKETPLIGEAVELLEDIIHSLKTIRDSEFSPNGNLVSPIIRVAAHSGVLVAEKYFKLLNECEVYVIAMVMSPEKKLQWFSNCGWSQEKVAEITEHILGRWMQTYVSLPTTSASSASSTVPHAINPSSMSLGSWCNAPFYDIYEAIDALEKSMRREKVGN